MKLTNIFTLLLAVLLPLHSAQAQVEQYGFDKAHTQILFFVDHLGFSKSQGEFHDYDGTISFDRGTPEKSKVDIVIQTASIDMDDEKWDTHMKSDDFFSVEKFPAMTFKSTSIAVTGENTATITGDMTILATTKPVALAVKFNKAEKHPYSGLYTAGFSATTTIKRSDFGMNYGLPFVGDDVQVMLEVEATRQGDEAAAAREPAMATPDVEPAPESVPAAAN